LLRKDFREKIWGCILELVIESTSIHTKFFKIPKSTVTFSPKAVFRREYSGVLATVIGFVYIQFLRNFFALQKVFISTNFITVLIITAAAALILRSLKHYTSVLKEEEKD
jgi:hypothetical protein